MKGANIILDSEEIVAGLMQELRRGSLILLVLSALKKPAYGYNLIKVLEENGVPMETNTLYPLLRRLEGQGLLQSEWETSEAKPRKYYALTALGAEVLESAKTKWYEFQSKVNTVLEDGNEVKS